MDDYERKTHNYLVKAVAITTVISSVVLAIVSLGNGELIDHVVPLIKLILFSHP